MKLTTVVGSVNENPEYYKFIPLHIEQWKKLGIRYIAVFCGQTIPDELKPYENHIYHWYHNPNVNSTFLGQNVRIYFPSLLELPDDEMVMISDMDVLPLSKDYFCGALDKFSKNDFISYRRPICGNQIVMCYNLAHPDTWKKAFNVYGFNDVVNMLNSTYNSKYTPQPGRKGWNWDQKFMYRYLTRYPVHKIFHKKYKRLQMPEYERILQSGNKGKGIWSATDVNFHRSYNKNVKYIEHYRKEMEKKYKQY